MDNMNDSWRKSTYSTGNGGDCVEIGKAAAGILVRDTKDRAGHVMRVSAGEWKRFVGELKSR